MHTVVGGVRQKVLQLSESMILEQIRESFSLVALSHN